MSQQEYPKDYYRMPPLLPIPRPYRYKEVTAGTHETIFEWDVPSGHIGFIKQIANALAENGYWQLLFDNMPYREDDKVEYVLGHINTPLILDPPIKVKRSIRFIYYNNDENAVQIECLCAGVYGLDLRNWIEHLEVEQSAKNHQLRQE